MSDQKRTQMRLLLSELKLLVIDEICMVSNTALHHIHQRLKEIFGTSNSQFNRPAPENPPDIAEAEIDIDIDCNPPTREEIIRAIKKMKNGKAAGPDGIPAEALKADVETTADMLLPLFVKIWEQEETPTDWKDGHINKLPKKGE